MTARFEEVARQANSFANIYVVNCRLMDTLEHHEIHEAIKEVVINLLGSEELAIFAPNRDGKSWRLEDSFGLKDWMFDWINTIPESTLDTLRSGQVIRLGQPDAAPDAPDEKTLAIPLSFRNEIAGVILVGRLLPQKEALTSSDDDLMEFLSTYAGRTLHYADLYARQRANGFTQKGEA